MYVPHFRRRGLTEKQLEELKYEINKTEHQKTIEPYQKEINQLNEKIRNMEKDMLALYDTCQNIIESIDKDYIQIVINRDTPKAYFTNSVNVPLAKPNFEEIDIPIKEDLKNDFRTNLQYFREKYEKHF